MRTAFITGVVLGIAAVLTGARYLQWVDPPRLPSLTSVVANGGRAEQFLIRLPADRIAADGSGTGLRSAPFPAGAEFPEELTARSLRVEQFKVRDRDGHVIGIAARHSTEADGASSAAWLVLIPSRGALMLTSAGESAQAIDRALVSAGYRSGETWAGEVVVEATAARSGRVRGGRAEFEGLEGQYSEQWTVTGVGEAGELQGTIELDTVLRRGS